MAWRRFMGAYSTAMRIIHFSDFHAHWPWFDWAARESARYDLAIHSGDFVEMRQPRILVQADRVKAWSDALKGEWVFCSGNHEAEGLADHRLWMTTLGRTGVTTEGGRKVLAGSEITVSGWRDPLTPPAETELRWLAVHHEPPEETAVATDEHSDFGSFDLRQELEGQQPDVLFCGHQHAPTRWHDRVGKTLCLNPGRGTHPAVPNFIVYDDQVKRASYHVGGAVQTVLRLP
jgi:Icc-related predicted phosphoesterase